MAGSLDQAADHLMRAGDRAAHYLDDVGACALYQRALRAARSVLYGSDEAHVVQRYALLSVRLADALCSSGQLGLARGVLEEARPWVQGLHRLEALVARSGAYLSVGDDDLQTATIMVRRAIGHAIASGDGTLIAELYLDLATILTRGGDAELARRELEEGVDLVTAGEGIAARSGPPEMWRMLVRLAQLASGAGDHARALSIGQHALAHARRVGSKLGSARIHAMLASECDRLGQPTEAKRYREVAIDELRALGDRRSTAELILSVVSPTRTLLRIAPPALQEARALAREVGWTEGANLKLAEGS
jgi:tetratricopeptide (TPR) repeat protein